jgi:uncharacterized protein
MSQLSFFSKKFTFLNLLLLGFLSLIITSNLSAQKAVPELWGIRVHDDAHVLKQETVDQLEKELKIYEDSTSNQVAILIVQSLDGDVLEEYSLHVAEKWKLGKKDKDNGVLLLVAVDDHKMRIEVGQGLEGVLTDAQSNRIIRNEIAPEFRRGDYDAGVKAGINGIVKAIAGEYSADNADGFGELSLITKLLISLGVTLFVSIFAFMGLIAPGCVGWGLYVFLMPFYALFPTMTFDLNYWYVPLGIYAVLFPILKIWIGKKSWVKKIGKSSGGSSSKGKGFWSEMSSGSSWSSGSSGSSWSSGGSSFSGGGGSFGGGGSSGGW